MSLSKNTISILVDMIENKLALIQISDRNELREVMALQHCLSELRGLPERTTGAKNEAVPTRGRHKKLERMLNDFEIDADMRKMARTG